MQSPTGPAFEGGGEFDKTLATAVQSLTQRSQGITLFRDGSYNLCAMLLNDFITPQEYVERWDQLLIKSHELVKFELEKNTGKIGNAALPSLSAPEQQKLEALLDDYWANRGSVFAKPETDGADDDGTETPSPES